MNGRKKWKEKRTKRTTMKTEIFEEDYDFNIEDDDRMATIKEAIKSLRPVERKIFLVYVELGTYSGVAREFGVSVPTACNYIRNIREKLKTIIDKEDDNRPTDN